MKRYIRYLYEYENGRRIRNVGFVKVEESDEDCVVHIHGKGLRLKSQTDMDVYAFYKDGSTCMGVWQGEIKNVNPTINYRLEFRPEDVGGTKRYSAIEGIILTNFSRPRYASVWNDMPADIENMMIVGKEENFSRSGEPAKGGEEDMGSAASDIITREERIEQPEAMLEEMPEMNQRPVMPEQPEMNQRPRMPEQPEMNQRPRMPEQPEMNQRPVMPEQPEMNQRPRMPEQPEMNRRPVMPEQPEMNQRPRMPEQPEMRQQPEIGRRAGVNQRPRMQMPPEMERRSSVMTHSSEPERPDMSPQPGGAGMMMVPEEEQMEPEAVPMNIEEPETAADSAEVAAEETPLLGAEMNTDTEPDKSGVIERERWDEQSQIRYRKITRDEMSELPRREWRLANNSFLLHGYYNYHHLVLISEDDKVFLGVPGVYHEREKTAAEAFGFGNFIKYPKGQLELTEEERDGTDFGYWYRQISRH